MTRVVRGQLALDTGDRLRDLGRSILHLNEYSGDALAAQLKAIDVGLAAQVSQLDVLIRSCRAAQNGYPNFPALRKALGDAGEEVYNLREKIAALRDALRDGWEDFDEVRSIGNTLIAQAQLLKLIRFVSPEGGTKQASA